MSDPYWKRSTEFLESHARPTDTAVLPDAMATGACRTVPYSTFLEDCDFDFFVLHKGMFSFFSLNLMERLVHSLYVSFANEVFVIFSRKPLPVSPDLLHVEHFIENYKNARALEEVSETYRRAYREHRINDLIKGLPEIYQSIYLNGELLAEGVRKNDAERLEAIESLIKPNQTVLDVGSNIGYFTIELAKMFPDNVFVSIEKDERYAQVQRELLLASGLKNVLLINGGLNSDWLSKAAESCVFFDNVLCLSVLHHFDNPIEVLKNLAKISKQIIIEMPDPDEELVCGKEVLQNLKVDNIKGVKSHFEQLPYESVSHCSDVLKRKFYRLYDVAYDSTRVKPYINYNGLDKEYTIKSNDESKLLFSTKINYTIIHMMPGICLDDIIKLGGLLYPLKPALLDQIELEFDFLNRINLETNVVLADIRPWNILFSAKGCRFIDYVYFKSDLEHVVYNRQKDFNLIMEYIDGLLD